MTVTDLEHGVLERLARAEIAWLCTLRSDGSPHVTPVWFVFWADTWWVASARSNKKVRNVAVDPRVSLALEDGAAPVVAEGEAVLHQTAFPRDVVARFAERYREWNITASGPHGPYVLLEIPVTRWLLVGQPR